MAFIDRTKKKKLNLSKINEMNDIKNENSSNIYFIDPNEIKPTEEKNINNELSEETPKAKKIEEEAVKESAEESAEESPKDDNLIEDSSAEDRCIKEKTDNMDISTPTLFDEISNSETNTEKEIEEDVSNKKIEEETAKEESTKEEHVEEEKKEKKTRKRRKSTKNNKKEDTGEEMEEDSFSGSNNIDFGMNYLGTEIRPTSEAWEAEKETVNAAMEEVLIKKDMTPEDKRELLSNMSFHINDLNRILVDAERDYENLVDLIKTVKVLNAIGVNSAERNINSELACRNYKINPDDEKGVNLNIMLYYARERYNFYKSKLDQVTGDKISLNTRASIDRSESVGIGLGC